MLAKREPDRMVAGCARAAVDLGKAGEGDEAAMLHPEPASPMGRSDIANIGDAGIGALACQKHLWCRHTPARQGQLPAALRPVPDDRRGIVGEDSGHGWQIAGQIDHVLVIRAHVVKDMAHGVLALGLGVQIAHVQVRES